MVVSPLRYPGGKAKLFDYFSALIDANKLYHCTYCEPYAGGAGLALKLLANGFVEQIALNDIDESIYAFWHSVFFETEKFCSLIGETPVTVDEWYRQKSIWQSMDRSNLLYLGFSAFFLNRTNRSGIIEGAGPIGGYKQAGKWKIDVRYNKDQQIKNIQSIGLLRDLVSITQQDALEFVASRIEDESSFIYLDPPYYVKGSTLYRNFYDHNNHLEINQLLRRNRSARWVVSYDDVREIRQIYSDFNPISYRLNYSAGKKGQGQEVIFMSEKLSPPSFNGFESSAA